jgi:hypothetical protein
MSGPLPGGEENDSINVRFTRDPRQWGSGFFKKSEQGGGDYGVINGPATI